MSIASEHATIRQAIASHVRFFRARCDLSDVRDVVCLTAHVAALIERSRATLPVGIRADTERIAHRVIVRAHRIASRPAVSLRSL